MNPAPPPWNRKSSPVMRRPSRNRNSTRKMKLPLAATLMRVFLAATATVICWEPQTSLFAQNLQDVAEREIVRRQEDLVVAERLIIAGDRALAQKDYETAYVNYLDALDKVPAGSASNSTRKSRSLWAASS